MSDQTNPSPSGFFERTTFGAVKVVPATTRIAVKLTDEERKAFGEVEAYFSARTNREVLSYNFGTDKLAADFKAKIRAYADSRDGISASFPTHNAGNDYPDTWNKGTNVTFRLTKTRVKANGEVTTTTTDAK